MFLPLLSENAVLVIRLIHMYKCASKCVAFSTGSFPHSSQKLICSVWFTFRNALYSIYRSFTDMIANKSWSLTNKWVLYLYTAPATKNQARWYLPTRLLPIIELTCPWITPFYRLPLVIIVVQLVMETKRYRLYKWSANVLIGPHLHVRNIRNGTKTFWNKISNTHWEILGNTDTQLIIWCFFVCCCRAL